VGGLYGGGGGGGNDTGALALGGAGRPGACRLIFGVGRAYPLQVNATGSLNHG
jgi:hypothetical protein